MIRAWCGSHLGRALGYTHAGCGGGSPSCIASRISVRSARGLCPPCYNTARARSQARGFCRAPRVSIAAFYGVYTTAEGGAPAIARSPSVTISGGVALCRSRSIWTPAPTCISCGTGLICLGVRAVDAGCGRKTPVGSPCRGPPYTSSTRRDSNRSFFMASTRAPLYKKVRRVGLSRGTRLS